MKFLKSKKFWLVLALSLVLVLALRPTPPSGAANSLATTFEIQLPQYVRQQQPYSALLRQLTAGLVTQVGVTEDGVLLVKTKTGTMYYVARPVPGELLTGALQSSGGKKAALVSLPFKAFPEPAIRQLLGALLTGVVLPMLPILLMLYFLNRGVAMFGRTTPFEVTRNTKVRFSDVVGADDAKQAMGEVVDYLRNPAKYAKMGVRPPRGVLMEGPPGTGKTLMAQAVAGECGVPFFKLDGSRFTAPIAGLGVMKVRKLFQEARRLAPCVLFIDEIDGMGKRTATPGPGGVEMENNRIINALLTEMDGFEANLGIVVIAATNHQEALDAALVREGRFDRKCLLTLPSLDERLALFSRYCGGVASQGKLDYLGFARLSAGMSPAAIATAVNQAALNAVRANRGHILDQDVQTALQRQQLGEIRGSAHAGMAPELRYRLAVHEAGHALVGLARGVGTLGAVTVVPRARALGATMLEQSDDMDHLLRTEDKLRAHIDMLLAGREAEKLILGDYSTGAADDLRRASELALAMVTSLGIGGRYGAFSMQALPPRAHLLQPRESIEDASALLAARQQATSALLLTCKDALLRLAHALAQSYTLTGAEAEALLADPPAAA